MKHLLIATAIAISTFTAPLFAADVGVSVSIGQPGFYGRIDIGDYPYPHPRVIYREPRVVERVYVDREPIYLRVPPGHAKNWPRYCRRYNACGERVYFVQDSWYERDYVPYYQDRYARDGDRRYDNDGHHEEYRGNRDGDDGEDHNGKGRGKGKGNGNGRHH